MCHVPSIYSASRDTACVLRHSKWDKLEVSSSDEDDNAKGGKGPSPGLGRSFLSGGGGGAAPPAAGVRTGGLHAGGAVATSAQPPWLLDPSRGHGFGGSGSGGGARASPAAAAKTAAAAPPAVRGGAKREEDAPKGGAGPRDDVARAAEEPAWDGDAEYDDETHGPAGGLVVFLHNAGDTAGSCRAGLNNHFVWRGEFEPTLERARVRVCYPSAPLRPLALVGGETSTAWFDISDRDPATAREVGARTPRVRPTGGSADARVRFHGDRRTPSVPTARPPLHRSP